MEYNDVNMHRIKKIPKNPYFVTSFKHVWYVFFQKKTLLCFVFAGQCFTFVLIEKIKKYLTYFNSGTLLILGALEARSSVFYAYIYII